MKENNENAENDESNPNKRKIEDGIEIGPDGIKRLASTGPQGRGRGGGFSRGRGRGGRGSYFSRFA